MFTVDTHVFHIEYFTHIDSKRIHSCIARNDHSLNKSYIGKPGNFQFLIASNGCPGIKSIRNKPKNIPIAGKAKGYVISSSLSVTTNPNAYEFSYPVDPVLAQAQAHTLAHMLPTCDSPTSRALWA